MAAIGAGTGGVVTGAAAGASTGAMAGGAGAFSSLGAAAWVPVVGWILAIAALVDLASGGKLFGTAFRPEKLESTIGIRDGQAMADNQLTEVRQRSLFRGRTWRSRSLEVPDEMQQAAQSLYDTLYDIGIGTAARLQADAPPLMDVAIRTITEYDKKGREKATKIFVDILGRSFEEASEELAGKRVVAETIINVLDSVFAGVSSTAERWRGDAEKLLEGAEFLVLALSDVRRGFTLLSSDSSIDDLVDLIEMLSMGSESLSDTYARVAASVRILEDALWLMNSSLDVAREDFVIFANDIAVAAGGLDRAQQLWSSYFNTFFTAQERAELALLRSEERAGTALGAIGLDPSIFMDEGGAQLFRSMFTAVFDQLTPQQVVLWLEAGEALAAVFGAQQQYNEALGQVVPNLEALAEATRSYAEFVYSLQEQLDSMDRTDFVNSLTEIAREMENNRQRMHELARAAGLAEARSEDLAVAVSLAARKFQEAIAKLNEETRKLAVDLYGTPLSRLEEEIRRLEQASRDAGTGVSNAGDSFERFVDSTRQAVEDLLLDKNLSPLNDREMLEVALGRLSRTGSEQDARTTLEIGRRLFASGRDYEQLFRRVTAMIRPEETNGSPGTSGGPISSPELERLYAERDRLREEEEAIRRRALAMQFAQNVADLSGAEELDFQTILDRFDVSVAQLAADLGLDEDELFGFLETLMNATYDLEDFVEVYNAGVDRIVAAVEGSRVMEENAPLIESVPLLPIAMDEGTPVFGEIDEEDFVDLSETTAAITEVNETLRDLLSRIADSSAETVVALQASAEAAAVRAVELVANTNRSGFTNDYRSIVK
jgi:IS1 family transposase